MSGIRLYVAERRRGIPMILAVMKDRCGVPGRLGHYQMQFATYRRHGVRRIQTD